MSTQAPAVQQKSKRRELREFLESEELLVQVKKALPKHLTAERFLRVASTAMLRIPDLATCDQMSFFNALLTLSQLGLEPDGRLAHLIPFRNTKKNIVECQLIIDYKGLVDLAMRSGNVSNIHADRVCQNDEFEYDRGEIKKHKIDFRNPRGDAYAYYALVRFKDGTEKSEVMTKEEVDRIKGMSKANKFGPWVDHYDEMAKKTVFRRLSKWITLSPEFREALDKDDDRLDDLRFEMARPATGKTVDRPDFTPEPDDNGGADENPVTEKKPPLDFSPQTPQEELACALRDLDIDQQWFVSGLRKVIGKAQVPESVTIVHQLSDDVVAQVFNDGLDHVLEIIRKKEGAK